MSTPHEYPLGALPTEITSYVDRDLPVDEPLHLTEGGTIRAVVLSSAAYAALLDRLEDLSDSLSILEARASGEPTRPFEAYLREHAARETFVRD